jgi:hypothetical protein
VGKHDGDKDPVAQHVLTNTTALAPGMEAILLNKRDSSVLLWLQWIHFLCMQPIIMALFMHVLGMFLRIDIWIAIAAVLIGTACEGRGDSDETTRQLQELTEQVKELKELLQTTHEPATEDTATAMPKPPVEPKAPSKQQTVRVERPPKPERPPEPKQPQVEDTIRHLYSNGSLSVKISPWSEGRQSIWLYDLYGRNTFETENIRHSYSVSNDLKFHPNGAVSTIIEHMNPGASLYMYKSTMTFSTTNEPLVRKDEKWPSSLDEIMKERPWFWNKQTRQWIQQEIVIETNWPEDTVR